MKNGAGVVSLIDILQEMRHRERRAFGVQFHREISEGSNHQQLGGGGRLGRSFRRFGGGRRSGGCGIGRETRCQSERSRSIR